MVILDVVVDPLEYLFEPGIQSVLIPVAIVAVAAVTVILFLFGGKKK